MILVQVFKVRGMVHIVVFMRIENLLNNLKVENNTGIGIRQRIENDIWE